jgi:hypothetical protein
MRMRGAVVLAFVLILFASPPAMSGCGDRPADCDRTIGVGGGVIAGGYFGELKHDWNLGMGGSLFMQTPLCCSFEGRLRASMLWNDGSGLPPHGADAPDLGALAGERAHSFRRATYELSLLHRMECRGGREFAVPYLGAGFSAYERRVEYQSGSGGWDQEAGGISLRTHSAWDLGFHGIGGIRFYRTTGYFVGLEGTFHAIDTPTEWTGAYDISLLLGLELSR